MGSSGLMIGSRLVDEQHPLLIAEIASAHDGQVEQACALVRAAADGAGEAVKFQLVIAEELLTPSHPDFEMFHRLELKLQDWQTVVGEARQRGLISSADVFGEQSLRLAQDLGIQLLKIPSSSLTDPVLVPLVASRGVPTLLSVAGATEEEIAWVVEQFRQAGHRAFVLIHGFQGFPTPLAATHLNRLSWLRQRFACPVGLSDHLPADTAVARHLPLVAVGLGASVIEKHLTQSRSRRGPDWVSALEPAEFGQLQEALRHISAAFGPEEGACWMEGEARYRRQMRRQLVAGRTLQAGEILTADKITQRRAIAPGSMDPWFFPRRVAGKTLRRSLSPDEAITWDSLSDPLVAVLIAVRMKSARLPRKALADLAGKPVIERLVERMKTARHPQRLVLCTSTHADDRVLVELARRLGIEWVCGEEEDVMARFLRAAEQTQAELIVRVTGDNPLTDAETMDRMIVSHLERDVEYTYTDDLPFGTRPEIISVEALRRVQALAEDPGQTEYMTAYLKQPEAVKSYRYVVQDAQLVRPHYRLTLDTPEDLAVLQQIYARFGPDGSTVSLREVIRLLDQSPELVAMNAAVQQRQVAGVINARLRAPRAPAEAGVVDIAGGDEDAR